MTELIRLFAQIALLRRGPQDLPASGLLLALAVIAYLAVNCLVASFLPAVSGWPAHLAIDVAFTLAWYYGLLRVAGHPERNLQTSTAVFGYQAVLTPLLLVSEYLMRRFAQDTTWQLPVALMWLILVVWVVAANSHIVKAALDWSIGASVGLVILQIIAGQLLLYALFPQSL